MNELIGRVLSFESKVFRDQSDLYNHLALERPELATSSRAPAPPSPRILPGTGRGEGRGAISAATCLSLASDSNRRTLSARGRAQPLDSLGASVRSDGELRISRR